MKKNPLEKKWEFETNEGYMADKFLQILECFGIEPEDCYIPSFIDYSQIEFRTTRRRKEQIEAVYKRYLLPDPYKKFQRKEKGYYAIY